MVKVGIVRSSLDHCLYFKDTMSDGAVYLLSYVDDILIAGPNSRVIQFVKDFLKFEFDMKGFRADKANSWY